MKLIPKCQNGEKIPEKQKKKEYDDSTDAIKRLRDAHPIADFVARFIPGVGETQDVQDVYYGIKNRDWLMAGLSLLGLALPVVSGGQIRKGLKAIGAISDEGSQLRKGFNSVTDNGAAKRLINTEDVPILTSEADYIKKVMKDAKVSRVIGDYNDQDISKLFQEYSNGLSEINPNFLNKHYIENFKNFLHNKGYKIRMSNEDIAKIITDNYNKLKETNSGLLDGKVFWNASPTRRQVTYNNNGELVESNYLIRAAPEKFEMINNQYRTSPTENKGVFFSKQPFYGYIVPRDYYRNNAFQIGPDGYDMQPYLLNINNIKQADTMQNGELTKGTIEYYLGFKGNHPLFQGTKDPEMFGGEYRISHDTQAKSLYPHPETITRGADGKLTLNRSWNDSRMHYVIGIPLTVSTIRTLKSNNSNNNN